MLCASINWFQVLQREPPLHAIKIQTLTDLHSYINPDITA